ncbi:unnamed protein product [Linum trigynum]|uniref:Uncharacterized protein n=1 Tax=Linum trigynum TaxID=586398 RepID=A0AAV2CVF3_9ROSI
MSGLLAWAAVGRHGRRSHKRSRRRSRQHPESLNGRVAEVCSRIGLEGDFSHPCDPRFTAEVASCRYLPTPASPSCPLPRIQCCSDAAVEWSLCHQRAYKITRSFMYFEIDIGSGVHFGIELKELKSILWSY